MNRSLLTAVVTLLIAPAATAQVHLGDVILETNSGSIETLASFPGNPEIAVDRVFAADIADGNTNDPGFDNLNGTFQADQDVFLDIMSHLRSWDGLAWQDASGTQIRITRGFDGPVLSPLPGEDPALGFAVAANSSGKWHKHYLFTREGPSSDGAYALELRLRTDTGTPGNSEHFWFIFNNGTDAAGFDAAVEAARATLVDGGTNPCPGDLADSSGFGPADGLVDFGDFFALSFLAGPCPGGTPGCAGDLADSSGFGPADGVIDFGDFFALSFLAGPCP